MTPTERFIALVQGPEEQLALDEAALLLAAHAEPELDVAGELRRLDDLAGSLTDASATAVADVLFGRLGLRGNTEDYGDPRNSYLNQVLDRRLGIPISLAVLMIEVGRRAGVTLEGIGMPGHFLVRGDGEVRDPFEGGRALDHDACAALFRGIHGPKARFTPAMLAPVGPRTILARMLANLRQSYIGRRDPGALEWVVHLRVAIPGVPAAELVDLARLLAELGRFAEAAKALDDLTVAGVLNPQDSAKLHGQAIALKARLN
ncbi:MAG TPA: transglutaminase-like domain-containing protein [Acidimicrobiales bacterium]